MLLLQDIGYAHPDKDILFQHLNLSVNRQDKIALIGNNGVGKSTLLQIMAGRLRPFEGTVKTDAEPYYIPQIFGQYNELTVAEALRVADKLHALKAITDGDASVENFNLLDDDWGIEERCNDALARWGLDDIDLSRSMSTLSGGQKTKVFLAGIAIHTPEIVLMDEPSNHLDRESRAMLYEYIQTANQALVVVSHDRTLLNLLPTVCELSRNGITTYGGNYEFYAEQKAIAANALSEDLRSKEKTLRKAKEVERQGMERQQKQDARGRKKQEKAGMPTIMQHLMRNAAENSTARMKDVHAEKTAAISKDVHELRKELPDKDKMKLGFDASALHSGKILIRAKDINYGYNGRLLWK
ncbi:MAG: ATP-binding cassette domain-containing protein [Flavipsychrobacter sp.]